MKGTGYFLAVRVQADPSALVLGQDIFLRPMPWGLWFKALVPSSQNPWRFVRVVNLEKEIFEYQMLAVEDEELVIDDDVRFGLEKATVLIAVFWALESIYYGTSLRFWKWPVSVEIREKVKRFFSSW